MFKRSSGKLSGVFQPFNPQARKAIQLAQEEAQKLNHNYMGTEHLLLGLVDEGEGIAARALQNLGADPPRVRQAVMVIIGIGDRVVLGDVGLTPRAKKVIELAVDEARRLNHHYVDTEHLLLGLIREGEGIGAGVLVNMGITLEHARKEVIRLIGQGTPGEGATEQPGPKNNVVTCRLDDAAVGALDALVEAGIRSTRSDAAAWLISAGIEAHHELFDRVNTTVNEIRKLRLEAQDIARQVTRDAAEREAPESEENTEGEIQDPEEPEDLDDLNDLDEPPDNG